MEHDIIYNIKDYLILEMENITESFCSESGDNTLTMDETGKYNISLYCGAENMTKEQRIKIYELVKSKFGITDCYVKHFISDVDDITEDVYGFDITFTIEI